MHENKHSNEESFDLPLYSPEQENPSSPSKIGENVPSPHECKNTELLTTSSAVPGKLTHPTYIVFHTLLRTLIIFQLIIISTNLLLRYRSVTSIDIHLNKSYYCNLSFLI